MVIDEGRHSMTEGPGQALTAAIRLGGPIRYPEQQNATRVERRCNEPWFATLHPDLRPQKGRLLIEEVVHG